MNTIKKLLLELLVLIIVISGSFICIRLFALDIKLSELLYKEQYATSAFLNTLAFIGKYLPVVIATICLFSLPRLFKKNHSLKKEALLAVCLLVVGPGLINNYLLKPYFKRPRPVEINHFNKEVNTKFIEVLQHGTEGKYTSFPSGHCGAAFSLMFPWFCIRHRKKHGFLLIVPGFAFGSLVALVRIMQGRHFLSDTIAAFAVVYLSGLLLAGFMFRANEKYSTSQ